MRFASLLAGLLLLAMPAEARSGGEAAITTAAADPAMPAMLHLALIRSRADEVDPAYHIEDNGRGANPRHGLGLAFTAQGARIDGLAGGFALRLERFGRGARRPVRRAAPRIEVDDRDAAYPLLIDPWVEQAKLTADDGLLGDSFGLSVALAGDTALVGAPGPLNFNLNPGAAYVFTRNGDTWSQQAKLTANDGAAFDNFGLSVALAGDTALAGAVFADIDGEDNQGAAYVFRLEPSFAPAALAIDPPGLAPEANGVFDPGETVDVAPAWRNDSDVAGSLAGTASSFTGPAGATYSIDLDTADYGLIEPAATADCLDTEICYRLALDDPAARPAKHWDATFDETLDDSDGTVKTWTLHIGDSFTDVPRSNLFYPSIETVLHHVM